jgi:hypothetical protein
MLQRAEITIISATVSGARIICFSKTWIRKMGFSSWVIGNSLISPTNGGLKWNIHHWRYLFINRTFKLKVMIKDKMISGLTGLKYLISFNQVLLHIIHFNFLSYFKHVEIGGFIDAERITDQEYMLF